MEDNIFDQIQEVDLKKTMEESIQHQLNNLKQNKEFFETNKNNKRNELNSKIKEIEKIDFEKEENNLKKLSEYETILKENETNKELQKKIKEELTKAIFEFNSLNNKIDSLKGFDFNKEKKNKNMIQN